MADQFEFDKQRKADKPPSHSASAATSADAPEHSQAEAPSLPQATPGRSINRLTMRQAVRLQGSHGNHFVSRLLAPSKNNRSAPQQAPADLQRAAGPVTSEQEERREAPGSDAQSLISGQPNPSDNSARSSSRPARPATMDVASRDVPRSPQQPTRNQPPAGATQAHRAPQRGSNAGTASPAPSSQARSEVAAAAANGATVANTAAHTPGSAAPATRLEAQGESSPASAAFMQELVVQHERLLASAEQQKAQIAAAHQQQIQAAQQMVEAEARQVEGGYNQVIERIRRTAASQRQAIFASLEAERSKINTLAQAEIARLDTIVNAQKTSALAKGNEKAGQATQLGNQEAQRAQQGSAQRAQQVQSIGRAKAAQYSTGENGADVARAIQGEVPNLVGQFTRTGNDVAGSVRQKAATMAQHFRQEAGEIAGKLGSSTPDARRQIIEGRDKTLQTLQKIATDSAEKISQQATELVQKLAVEKGQKSAQVRQAAPEIMSVLNQGAANARTKIDTETRSTSTELRNLSNQLRDGTWYQPFANEARANVLAAVTARQNEQRDFAAQVTRNFQQSVGNARTELTQQTQTIRESVNKLGSDFETNAGQIAQEARGKLQEASTQGETTIKSVAPEFEAKLQEAVEKSDQEWAKQLAEKGQEIRNEVNEALAKEDSIVNKFASDIDERAARVANRSTLDKIIDFVAGAFEGLWEGLVTLFTELWEAVRTPLFWIVVAVGVVVLAIAVIALMIGGAGFLAAVGLVLAVAMKVLLVIGVIIAVIAAGYFLYLMATTPNLSWRERGRLFGRALFEGIMGFTGTGILKRITVFAQVGRLRQFVASVGGVGKALRLIARVPNLERLTVLVNKVGDATQLLQLLDRTRDTAKLITLIDTVGDARAILRLTQVINNPDDVLKLWRAVGNSEDILKLWGQLRNADEIVELWRGLGSADEILRLLKLPGMTTADLRFLVRAGMTADEVKTLVNIPGLTGERLRKFLEADPSRLAKIRTMLARRPITLRQLIDPRDYDEFETAIRVIKQDHPEVAHIPTDDLIAIRGYTHDDYYDQLNNALRTGNIPELIKLEEFISKTVHGMRQLPSHRGRFVRGETATQDLYLGKEGEVLTMQGFTSTDRFKPRSGNVQLVVNGETGKDVKLFSYFESSESEILFMPGSRFRVDRVHFDGTTYHVQLTEVP